MSSCFFSSREKIRISPMSEGKYRRRTALPKVPVPPVMRRVFPVTNAGSTQSRGPRRTLWPEVYADPGARAHEKPRPHNCTSRDATAKRDVCGYVMVTWPILDLIVSADALKHRTGFRPLGRPVVRFSLVFLFDAAIAVASLWIAMLLRFEGNIEAAYLALLPTYTAVLVASRFAANLLLRLHRWSFRLSGLHDGARVVVGAAAGSGTVSYTHLRA